MPPRSKKARQAARTSTDATAPTTNLASGIPTPPLGGSWGEEGSEEDLMSFQSSKKSEGDLVSEQSSLDTSQNPSEDVIMEDLSPILNQSNGGNSNSSLMEEADISGDEIANIAQVQQEAIDADESVLEVNQPVALKKNLSVAFEGIAEAEVEQKKLAPTPKNPTNEAIQVFLRIRPMSDSQPESTSTIRVQPSSYDDSDPPTRVRTYAPVGSFTEKQHRNSSDGTSTNPPAPPTLQEFTYSRVFDPNTTQTTLYQSSAAPLISALFQPQPQSSLLFAYGITNAGKSHTIMGSETEPGIVPRAMKDIFERMEGMEGECELFASYLEIYNEQVYDLVGEEKEEKRKGRVQPKRKALKLQDNHGTIVVKGLSKHKVSNTSEGLKLAAHAKGRRQVSGTNLNGVSSRSHSVCQLELVRKEKGSKTPKTGTFWIVDLAGSERSKRTGVGAKSSQQREASGINTSLMKLWRCLKQLRSNQMSKATAIAAGDKAPKAPIVPFRESKLTHLFMNHLAGSTAGRTVMIVNVNPQPADYDETQHVLNSATIAQSVKVNNEEFVKKEKVEQTHDKNGRSLKGIAEDEKAAKQMVNRRPSDTARGVSNVAMNSKMHQLTSENTALREALNSLKERLMNAESEIREEVAEEFEEMVAEIHEEYAKQKMRSERMGVPTPARSVRKLQSERANEYVDELHEKIKECEEEMTRMNEKHQIELAEKYTTIESLQSDLAELRENDYIPPSSNQEEEEIDAETNVSNTSCTTAGAIVGATLTANADSVIDTDGTVKYAQPVDTPEAEGDETDSDDESVVDLMTDEVKEVHVAKTTTPSVVAESRIEVKPDSEEDSSVDLEIVDGPGSDEKRKIDKNNQAKKLRRLPRGRCSEVACVPVKKEKVEKKTEEATPNNSSQGEASISTVKRRGLLAKLTGTGKKKNKRGATDENSGTSVKKAAVEDKSGRPSVGGDRKSLGEISNVSELTQPTVMSVKSGKGGAYKRPRGRGPTGKVWNTNVGEWEVKMEAA